MKFLDICAGIGGFRSGLEKAGHECVGYVEIDKYARKSYQEMYDAHDEWNAEDITQLEPWDLPQADLWTFGFPCQDISVAGKQEGLNGKRSGIFYSIIKLLKGQSTENKPRWLLVENVKNLLSLNGGREFTEVLSEISEAGYDAEWHLINSKDYGVPQNRERVFIIGYLRDGSERQILPITRTSKQADRERQIEQQARKGQGKPVRQKKEKYGDRFNHMIGNRKYQSSHVYGTGGVSRACDTSGEIYYAIPKQIIQGDQAHRVYTADGASVSLKAEGGGVGAKTGLYAIPVLTPERLNKRQNGRRFKEAGDPMFTLTAQDRHGVLVYKDEEYYIRRLTPRECFRLQGFTDEQFNKAQAVNSNTQLYRQAGNAVTVNVAEYLGRLLKDYEKTI